MDLLARSGIGNGPDHGTAVALPATHRPDHSLRMSHINHARAAHFLDIGSALDAHITSDLHQGYGEVAVQLAALGLEDGSLGMGGSARDELLGNNRV